MTNLKIGYSGGSGGFLLLHLLLLSGQYHTEFKENKTFAQAFEQQWKITNPDHWKSSETWPDNSQTYNTTSLLNKIYFFCNPCNTSDLGHYPGSTVILYTDYASQQRLAYYKKAHWYYKKDRPGFDFIKFVYYRTLLKNWRTHYQNIKDPTWPECASFRKIDQLPDPIKNEVLANPYTTDYLNYQYKAPVENYQNCLVYKEIMPVLKSADVAIKLQDLVNSNGEILSELFPIPPMNKQQLELLHIWKNLHPKDLLDKIGISS
jgi:hypothetical protein